MGNVTSQEWTARWDKRQRRWSRELLIGIGDGRQVVTVVHLSSGGNSGRSGGSSGCQSDTAWWTISVQAGLAVVEITSPRRRCHEQVRHDEVIEKIAARSQT
jgi:hypothetical protein